MIIKDLEKFLILSIVQWDLELGKDLSLNQPAGDNITKFIVVLNIV